MKKWLLNVVEGRYRCWDDFFSYGMASAGHGNPPSAPLKLLSIGDEVYAFLNRRGYVGRGRVTQAAVLAEQFIVTGDFVAKDGSGRFDRVKLTEILLLRRSDMREDAGDPVLGNGSSGSNGFRAARGRSRSALPECRSRGTRLKNSPMRRRRNSWRQHSVLDAARCAGTRFPTHHPLTKSMNLRLRALNT